MFGRHVPSTCKNRKPCSVGVSPFYVSESIIYHYYHRHQWTPRQRHRFFFLCWPVVGVVMWRVIGPLELVAEWKSVAQIIEYASKSCNFVPFEVNYCCAPFSQIIDCECAVRRWNGCQQARASWWSVNTLKEQARSMVPLRFAVVIWNRADCAWCMGCGAWCLVYCAWCSMWTW